MDVTAACDVGSQLLRLEERLLEIPGCDLYVLPELFATGFDLPVEVLARVAGKLVRWMEEMARRLEAGVMGSVAVMVNGRLRNRLYLIGPDGVVDKYDKRHVFRISGEEAYEGGVECVVSEWRGVRLWMGICYDLRFPVWSRNVDGRYDLAVYVARWPLSRRSAWRVLLQARALENQCMVVGVNGCGGSLCVDAKGRIVTELGDREGVTVAVFDAEEQRAFREKFPVLQDGDKLRIEN